MAKKRETKDGISELMESLTADLAMLSSVKRFDDIKLSTVFPKCRALLASGWSTLQKETGEAFDASLRAAEERNKSLVASVTRRKRLIETLVKSGGTTTPEAPQGGFIIHGGLRDSKSGLGLPGLIVVASAVVNGKSQQIHAESTTNCRGSYFISLSKETVSKLVQAGAKLALSVLDSDRKVVRTVSRHIKPTVDASSTLNLKVNGKSVPMALQSAKSSARAKDSLLEKLDTRLTILNRGVPRRS